MMLQMSAFKNDTAIQRVIQIPFGGQSNSGVAVAAFFALCTLRAILQPQAIPRIVDLSTDLLRKAELQVVNPSTTAMDRFLLKTRGVFRESEKEIVSQDCAIKGREKMWSRGCNKGSADVSVLWRNR